MLCANCWNPLDRDDEDGRYYHYNNGQGCHEPLAIGGSFDSWQEAKGVAILSAMAERRSYCILSPTHNGRRFSVRPYSRPWVGSSLGDYIAYVTPPVHSIKE